MANGQRIPWSRVLIEGVVIVGSILLAFGIDAWWDDRNDAVQELEVLRSLLSEFEVNQLRIDFYQKNHELGANYLAEVNKTLAAVPEGSLASVADSFLVATLLVTSLDVQQGALSAVLQSGALSSINDPVLRRLLADWPARVEDATENTQVLRADIQPRFRSVIMRDVNIARLLRNDVNIARMLRTPVSDYRSGHSELRSTKEASGLLALTELWLREAAREDARLITMADSITTLLKAELDR